MIARPAAAIRALLSVQFVSFLFVGASAAGVNWTVRLVLEPHTGFIAAVILAYQVGMATAFLLNRRFVFP